MHEGGTESVQSLRDIQKVLAVLRAGTPTALRHDHRVESALDVLGQQRRDELTALHPIERLSQLQNVGQKERHARTGAGMFCFVLGGGGRKRYF